MLRQSVQDLEPYVRHCVQGKSPASGQHAEQMAYTDQKGS